MDLSAVGSVVTKLGALVAQEVSFLQGVDDQVKSLRDEFEWIQCFLKDVDRNNKHNERLKIWIRQIRDVAYDAEDVIDTYVLRIERQRHRCICLMGSLGSWVGNPPQIKVLHGLGNQIERINLRVEKISQNKSKYTIESIGERGDQSSGATSSGSSSSQTFKQHLEVRAVGLDADEAVLVKHLINGDTRRRAVISIVGMGGLGKTTLANEIYNNADVKRYFDCHAWVSLSQQFRVEEVLLGIIKSVKVISNEKKSKMNEDELKDREELEKMSEEKLEKMSQVQLKKTLSNYLKGYTYLVVVDDIWSNQAWNRIEDAFPDKEKGSRVLLTTRNKYVAEYADSRSPPYQMKRMGENESWELFCTKAFPGSGTTSCPSNLEEKGKKMVEICDGLPLAIVVVGGLISRKEKSPDAWEKVLKSLIWNLREGPDQIQDILALSYTDLPYYLKPCFLYFGLFPEDSEIPVEKLIMMWVAEGFIQERGKETMEEAAEDYLEELIGRSMIQVAARDGQLGGVETLRMHDLLLDLSISEGKGERFLFVSRDGESMPPGTTRRLALSENTSKYFAPSSSPTPGLRSLMCLHVPKDHLKIRSLLGGLKLLRVIFLKGSPINKLPNEIGELIHLRYLGLQETKLLVLPSSIGNLCNLQTLDIRNTDIRWVPSGIWKMRNLRHLHGFMISMNGRSNSEGGLTNLQTLSHVNLDGGDKMNIEIAKMTNLRKLGIRFYKKYEPLYDFLDKLDHLKVLGFSRNKPIRLKAESFFHHKHLHELGLYEPFEKLPSREELNPNLTKIVLCWSGLEQDPLATLEKLPNLQILLLSKDAYVGNEMVCSKGGFPQLRVLEFSFLMMLEDWRVEDEAMPMLRTLLILGCHELKMLPEGLQKITTLQEVKLNGMSNEFTRRVKEGGEDWHKIKDVPSVTVT